MFNGIFLKVWLEFGIKSKVEKKGRRKEREGLGGKRNSQLQSKKGKVENKKESKNSC